jgi:tetratricopeptide (TPR) repeat protein
MHRRKWVLAACVVATASFVGPAAADDLATCRAGKGDSDVVAAACTAVITTGRLRAKELAEAHLNRGLARADNKAAIADYSEAIRLAPELVAAYVDRGVTYHGMGSYEHAVRDFLKAVELNPRLAIAWGDLGVTYSMMRDWNHAIEALTKAIALDPVDPVNLNNRCYAHNMTRAYDEAIKDCSKALELDPKYTLAFVGRGNGYWNKRDYDHAIENYSYAIALDPKRVGTWMARGAAKTNKGVLDAAITDYGEAIKLDPTRAQAWNGRCWARVIKGQAPAELGFAMADCNKALELQTNDAAIFDSRALVYLKLGKYDDAIADYDKALALDPTMATSLYGRGIAKNLKESGDAAGKQDIADAKRQTLTISDEMARYGVTPAIVPTSGRKP